MSQAKFTLTYDGPALRDHAMDVRDLAPAMLAVGELFDAVNLLLNGEKAEIRVNVKAHEPGCFSVIFEIVQNWKDGLVALFTGDVVTAALNLKELIVSGGGLLFLIKKFRGASPEKIERLGDNTVRITIQGETFDIPVVLLRMYQDIAVRSAVEKVVYKPLQKEGIESVEFSDEKQPRLSVNKAEAEVFKTPPLPEKIVVETTHRSAFSIVSLAFKDDNKWRLSDGGRPISAKIEDEAFLKRVNENLIRFAKGDVLVCEVHVAQKHTVHGLITDYIVKQVVEHIPAPRQLEMPWIPDEDGE
ncbi:hypothetical protein PJ900_11475 [Tistrella mobilis]|uniref:Uncharacterized protein n=1 Tax=Tistrella mobilis TaxID=171437 RepID=A0A162KBW5_9PROT|nr:hypothetical protein [Tistrella mobilis]KYO50889.1 hypothetical protein AUP44_11235 [Tistrella mobilis]